VGAAGFLDCYLAAQVHHALRAVILDDDRAGQHGLQGENLAFQEGLLVLGVFVFGVFDQLAVFLGVVQALGHLCPADGPQVVQFLFEFFQAFSREEGLLGHCCPSL